jgi:hypothetical protein
MAASLFRGATMGAGGAAAAASRREPWCFIMRRACRRRPQARYEAYSLAPWSLTGGCGGWVEGGDGIEGLCHVLAGRTDL